MTFLKSSCILKRDVSGKDQDKHQGGRSLVGRDALLKVMFINIINNVIINIATHFSRELSVIETLEADGTTKETSDETIKIGQEEVCLTIILSISLTFLFLCILGVCQQREEGRELRQGGRPGQDSDFFGANF